MSTSDLKRKARDILRHSYWWSFLVSLILFLVSGGINLMLPAYKIDPNADFSTYADKIAEMPLPMLMGIVSVVLVCMLISVLLSVFIRAPFIVGHNYFYIKAAENNVRVSNIGRGFQRGYLNCVKTMFLYNLYISLWSLLFIIPGIIKSYEYFMVEYILAENPSIPSGRAFEISKNTMKGQKFNVFVLQLSFTGWILLASLLTMIGLSYIGIYFVMPYYKATLTQMYFRLKEKALAMGYADYSDFSGQSDKNYTI